MNPKEGNGGGGLAMNRGYTIIRHMGKYNNVFNPLLTIFKALADENRLRALLALHEGELCVCQIVEFLGLAPSTVSKHMAILRQAGLVESRKSGRWVYYKYPQEPLPVEVRHTLDWINGVFKNDQKILLDKEKIAEIVKIDVLELCKKQCAQKKFSFSAPEILAEVK